MFVSTKHNSEETCKTMSLHVRRLSASFMECQEKETGLKVVHVWGQQRVSHVQWRQTGHQSNTQGACRAVNQWTTSGSGQLRHGTGDYAII